MDFIDLLSILGCAYTFFGGFFGRVWYRSQGAIYCDCRRERLLCAVVVGALWPIGVVNTLKREWRCRSISADAARR